MTDIELWVSIRGLTGQLILIMPLDFRYAVASRMPSKDHPPSAVLWAAELTMPLDLKYAATLAGKGLPATLTTVMHRQLLIR